MAKENTVRIGAGLWRSRLLRFPDALGLRPTPDRVRETLFNWLGQELFGLHGLDLFAGSGALGFEALSRGAASVTLVEKSVPVFKALKQNAAELKADAATLVLQDASDFLKQNTRQFDVIFLDPPFNQGWLEKVLPDLSKHLAENGLVYVEAEKSLADIAGWEMLKAKKAGAVHYHLLRPATAASE
jgi:16S rRNA (guanine(966)-N(2))-methyltransferase RsmD